MAMAETNVERIANKHQDEVKRRGLDPEKLQPLPEGDAFRSMEAASLEDDETVQKLWAGLLTSAMDPDDPATASKVFVDILKSIGPAEAGFLQVLLRVDRPIWPEEKTMETIFQAREFNAKEIDQLAEQVWRSFQNEARQNAIHNLMRLRCVGFRTGKQLKEDRMLPFGFNQDQMPANAKAVAKALDYVENLALAASGTVSDPWPISRSSLDQMPHEARYQFTPLGRSLMNACVKGDNLIEDKAGIGT